MQKNFPHYRQLDQMDCGPTCLRIVAKFFGKHYSAQSLREKTQISREGVSMLGISEAATEIGFKTIGVKISLEKLIKESPFPCILHWGQNHFVVLYSVEKQWSILGKHFLKGVWGGKRNDKKFDVNLVPREVSLETIDVDNSFQTNEILKYDVQYRSDIFYISDPASGLIKLTTKEFEKKWLSTRKGNATEGIALLLEPTTRFFEEAGEEAHALNFSTLLKYLWQYKGLVAQLALGVVAGSGLSLVFPFLTKSVVDIGIGTQNLSFINVVLIAQLVLLLSTAAVDFLRSWILLHISTRLNLTVLSDFLSKLMRLPVSYFDVKQFGDIMQRIGDHRRIESFLTSSTLNLIFSVFNLFVFGAILAWFHMGIFVVAVIASVIYTFWVVIFLKQRRKLDTRRFALSSQNQSQVVQLIQGMQDIKLSGAETSMRWEWERTQARLFKWNVRSLSFSQIQQAGGLLINNGKNIFITILAAHAVIDGQLTLGGMMSVQYILGQFNLPIEQMISFLQAWQDAQISLERLNEIHQIRDEEPYEIKTRSTWDHDRDIVLKHLSYTYPGAGNEPVLRDINLTIPHGKTTAIVGTSGSGKTTLLKILLKFYEPTHGKISLIKQNRNSENGILTSVINPLSELQQSTGFDLNLDAISHRAWRLQCGVVMQEGFLFSDTIARNIAVSDEVIDQDKLHRAANTANIHSFVESLPLGYHTKIGAEGNGISQGQKQRILIARAVYKDPYLLLFDEATNALDTNNEAVIMRNLEKFFIGKTVITVAHRLSTVKNADQIVVLEKGEIVEIGTHSQLVTLKGKYYELVSNQLELSKS